MAGSVACKRLCKVVCAISLWARNGEVWLLISQVTRASGKDRTSTVTDSNRMPSIDQHRIDFTDIGHVCCAPEVA